MVATDFSEAFLSAIIVAGFAFIVGAGIIIWAHSQKQNFIDVLKRVSSTSTSKIIMMCFELVDWGSDLQSALLIMAYDGNVISIDYKSLRWTLNMWADVTGEGKGYVNAFCQDNLVYEVWVGKLTRTVSLLQEQVFERPALKRFSTQSVTKNGGTKGKSMESLLGSSGHVDKVVQKIVEHYLDRCSHSAKASIANKMLVDEMEATVKVAMAQKGDRETTMAIIFKLIFEDLVMFMMNLVVFSRVYDVILASSEGDESSKGNADQNLFNSLLLSTMFNVAFIGYYCRAVEEYLTRYKPGFVELQESRVDELKSLLRAPIPSRQVDDYWMLAMNALARDSAFILHATVDGQQFPTERSPKEKGTLKKTVVQAIMESVRLSKSSSKLQSIVPQSTAGSSTVGVLAGMSPSGIEENKNESTIRRKQSPTGHSPTSKSPD